MKERSATRFRAYQLGSKGSSFSYFDGSYFTLIEARLTERSKISLDKELHACGLTSIHALHITSWDQDHCCPEQLEQIITNYLPVIIECPGYMPTTDSGTRSMNIIELYRRKYGARVVYLEPRYICGLPTAQSMSEGNIFFGPLETDPENNNNNSTIKLFGTGDFNVLSLGDVESPTLSERLIMCGIKNSEIDVMVLAHHGADNGFTTDRLLKNTGPAVAIACSEYDNQFDHPKASIRQLLYENDVKIFTTKTGDVLIKATGKSFGHFEVINYKSGNDKISSTDSWYSKKAIKGLQKALEYMSSR